jgi:putative ABC transport system permease protein
MIVLIVLAAVLGVVILYNLTNINVAERMRELSTIKVLGFYNQEVTMYIYRETILLSIFGISLAGDWANCCMSTSSQLYHRIT